MNPSQYPIPEDVLKEIEKACLEVEGGEDKYNAWYFNQGAQFGYSLAQNAILQPLSSQKVHRYNQIDHFVTRMGGWANFKTWVDKYCFNNEIIRDLEKCEARAMEMDAKYWAEFNRRSECEAKLAVAKEALEFYGNRHNWEMDLWR